MKKQRTVHGVGINDSKSPVFKIIDGKSVICPYYSKWQNMIKRCYKTSNGKDSSYKGCTVSREWLRFSNFKAWMKSQDWQGKLLDKDLIKQGNKVYSAENCIFVSVKINNLIRSKKGKYLKGVSYNKRVKKYQSHCHDGDKLVNLGYFETEIEAHKKYKEFKLKVIKKIAKLQQEPLKSALLRYKFD